MSETILTPCKLAVLHIINPIFRLLISAAAGRADPEGRAEEDLHEADQRVAGGLGCCVRCFFVVAYPGPPIQGEFPIEICTKRAHLLAMVHPGSRAVLEPCSQPEHARIACEGSPQS